ncbi:MAG: hypothetical protein ACLFPJ_02845 [Candidatus Woesearchaeota archaeon]
MKLKYLLIIFLLISLFFAFGCKEKECETSSECKNTRGTCFNAVCEEYKCEHKPILECCGNGICEEGENYCNCPDDCLEDTCEGNLLIDEIETRTRTKEIHSEYLQKMCSKNKCIVDIDTDSQQTVPFIFDSGVLGNSLSISVNVKKPLVINHDRLEIEVELRDTDKDFSNLKITEIQIVGSGNKLFGRNNNFNGKLDSVGSSFKTNVPITYTSDSLEMEESASMRFFYEYKSIDSRTDEERIKRGDFDRSFSEKLVMVDVKNAQDLI